MPSMHLGGGEVLFSGTGRDTWYTPERVMMTHRPIPVNAGIQSGGQAVVLPECYHGRPRAQLSKPDDIFVRPA